MHDLYLISDILVTDYSSVFFDYAILKRPILFYVYDIDNYRDKLRGFYFNLEKEAPGPLSKNTDDFINDIQNISSQSIDTINRINNFYVKYCNLESGKYCETVIKRILEN